MAFIRFSLIVEVNSERTNLSPFTKGYRGLASFYIRFGKFRQFLKGISLEIPHFKCTNSIINVIY